MNPIARTDRLIRQDVGQETLVYDRAQESAACLNELASAVWRHCDGQQDIDQLVTLVSAEVALPEGAEPRLVIEHVLNELDEHDLIAWTGEETATAGGMTRRSVLLKVAALALAPTIIRMVAPTTASAASGPPLPSATAPAPSI
ncbi:MAG: hypothetical protein JWO05_3327 [Gemmatimonadetes bacterium]|nr:hypothetical protein [Gemmatimonadota bacterium]